MTSLRRHIPSTFFIFSVQLAFLSCEKTPSPPPLPPVPVSAIRMNPQTIPADFEYIGVAASSHIVELRSRVEGYLESIHYKEGEMVREGDLMFVIDPRPFTAAVENAQGVLDRQKALLWNAEKAKERILPLYQQNAVSQRDLDTALSDQIAAQANVQSAQAELYQAKLNLEFASLHAPVTGLASQAKYREGALISLGGENLLTTIYVVNPIWVNFSISSRELLEGRREIEKGRLKFPENSQFHIEAILSDGTILPTEGFIDFTTPAIQQNTGTMLFRAVFPNPDLLIYPGQFIRVIIKGAVCPHAILVPQTAVAQGQKGPFVYVIEKGRAQIRPVVLGRWYQNSWIINEGLKAEDLVVAQGVNKLQNDCPIMIQEVLSNQQVIMK